MNNPQPLKLAVSDQSFLPEHFINRELSWLEFNARVLEEAEDADQPAAGAGEVPVDLQLEPRRVLHGPRGGPARAGLRRRRPAGLHARRPAGRSRSCSASPSARRSWSPRSTAAGTSRCCRSWPRQASALLASRRAERRAARDARPVLPRAGVSDSHADGDRPQPSQPALPQPRPVPGGACCERHRGLGPKQLFAVVQVPQVLPRLVPLGQGDEQQFILLEDVDAGAAAGVVRRLRGAVPRRRSASRATATSSCWSRSRTTCCG